MSVGSGVGAPTGESVSFTGPESTGVGDASAEASQPASLPSSTKMQLPRASWASRS